MKVIMLFISSTPLLSLECFQFRFLGVLCVPGRDTKQGARRRCTPSSFWEKVKVKRDVSPGVAANDVTSVWTQASTSTVYVVVVVVVCDFYVGGFPEAVT